MATELDALQLNFTASTSGAETSITRLIGKLQELSNSIGLINSGNFVANAENMVQSMNEIKTVADQTNSSNLKNIASGIKSLANSAKNISDGSNIRSFMENVASGLSELSDINTDFGGIKSLFNSISKLGTVDAGTALEKTATGLKSMQGITLPNFANAESFTEFLRGLGSKRVVAASGAITQLATGLRQFQGMSINVSGLSELAQAISVFGRKTAQTALTTIPQLATAFKDLITTLSTAPQVSRNVIDLTNALANFVANLRNVGGGATTASNGLRLFGVTASRTSKKTFSLASAIGKVYATYFLLFRGIRKIKDAIDISADLTEVQNVVDTSFGQMTDRVEEFAKSSVRDFGLSELSAKRYASRFQAMGVAMAIPAKSISEAQQQLNSINPVLAERGYSDVADSMADISLNLTKLTADMASFYNVAQEDVAKDLESVFTGSTRPLRTYGLDITNATLAEWAMKNGLDANIKSMSQAEKTLLRYQYVMANTSAVQGKLLVA